MLPQGYDPEDLLALNVSLPEGKYADEETRRTFVRETLATKSEMPGVTTVAVANVLPSRNANSGRRIRVEGDTTKEDASRSMVRRPRKMPRSPSFPSPRPLPSMPMR